MRVASTPGDDQNILVPMGMLLVVAGVWLIAEHKRLGTAAAEQGQHNWALIAGNRWWRLSAFLARGQRTGFLLVGFATLGLGLVILLGASRMLPGTGQ